MFLERIWYFTKNSLEVDVGTTLVDCDGKVREMTLEMLRLCIVVIHVHKH